MSRSAHQNKLLTLAVLSDGTIIQPKPPEPKTRADVYINIRPQFIHSPEDLVDAILTCEPLVEHFRERGHSRALALAQKVSNAGLNRVLTHCAALTPSERLVLHALRSDALNGWQNWIEFTGDGPLEVFKTMVRDWLAGPIDPSVDHVMANRHRHHHLALVQLENMHLRTLSALGVVIAAGNHACGVNRVALLRKSVMHANEAAQQLGLEIRFLSHSSRIPRGAAQRDDREVTS